MSRFFDWLIGAFFLAILYVWYSLFRDEVK